MNFRVGNKIRIKEGRASPFYQVGAIGFVVGLRPMTDQLLVHFTEGTFRPHLPSPEAYWHVSPSRVELVEDTQP